MTDPSHITQHRASLMRALRTARQRRLDGLFHEGRQHRLPPSLEPKRPPTKRRRKQATR